MDRIRRKNNSTVIRVVVSAVAGLVAQVAGLMFCAYLLTKNDIPHEFVKFFWIPVCVFSGAISGFLAGKLIKRKGLIWGSSVALIDSVILFSAIYIMNSANVGFFSFLIFPLIIIPGAISGIIGANLN